MKTTLKVGDRIKYRCHSLIYTFASNRKPVNQTVIKEVIIVAPAKGTDYHESDWIVCYPKDYPITDLRSRSNAKHWGICNNLIISP